MVVRLTLLRALARGVEKVSVAGVDCFGRSETTTLRCSAGTPLSVEGWHFRTLAIIAEGDGLTARCGRTHRIR